MSAAGPSACCPCAIDVPYLSSKAEMRRRILEQGGALVSEFPPGTEVQKWHFDVRNRLISGLSCGVLVAEAGVKSGTMLTVRHAAEQSRKIFTLPLGVWEENAEGMLRLLWDGAKPVSCAADILTEYQSRFPGFPVPPAGPLVGAGGAAPGPGRKSLSRCQKGGQVLFFRQGGQVLFSRQGGQVSQKAPKRPFPQGPEAVCRSLRPAGDIGGAVLPHGASHTGRPGSRFGAGAGRVSALFFWEQVCKRGIKAYPKAGVQIRLLPECNPCESRLEAGGFHKAYNHRRSPYIEGEALQS